MRSGSEFWRALRYALGVSFYTAFSVVGIGGFLFGLQLGRWTVWQVAIVTMLGLIAGVFGAIAGWRLAFDVDPLFPVHRTIGSERIGVAPSK